MCVEMSGSEGPAMWSSAVLHAVLGGGGGGGGGGIGLWVKQLRWAHDEIGY